MKNRFKVLIGVATMIAVLVLLVWTQMPAQAQVAKPKDKITVLVNATGGTMTINSSDFTHALYTKLDGSIDAVDTSDGLGNHQTIIYFNSTTFATADNGTNGAQGTLIAYTFPEGLIHNKGEVMDGTLTASGSLTATAALAASLGSATLDTGTTLTSTEADFVPSGTVTLASSTAAWKAVTSTSALFDGTSTPAKLRVNVASPDAGSSGAGTITMIGKVTVNWALLGDK